MDLFESRLLDSFGLVEMLYHFELEFGTPIPIDELDFENFNCVSKMAEFIARKKRARIFMVLMDPNFNAGHQAIC